MAGYEGEPYLIRPTCMFADRNISRKLVSMLTFLSIVSGSASAQFSQNGEKETKESLIAKIKSIYETGNLEDIDYVRKITGRDFKISTIMTQNSAGIDEPTSLGFSDNTQNSGFYYSVRISGADRYNTGQIGLNSSTESLIAKLSVSVPNGNGGLCLERQEMATALPEVNHLETFGTIRELSGSHSTSKDVKVNTSLYFMEYGGLKCMNSIEFKEILLRQ